MDSLKRSSCIKKVTTVDPYVSSLNMDSQSGLNSIIYSTNTEIKAVIGVSESKFLMDSEYDITKDGTGKELRIDYLSNNMKVSAKFIIGIT